MERMTYFENGRWYLKDGSVVCPIPRNNAMLCAAVEKLAAYENTKLSPAETSRLDWDYIESQIKPVTGCDNQPAFCKNDNFVSLWELLWNFNCEDDVCVVLEKIGEV